MRRAARWATLRYVSGRSPKAKRRHLRLAGGKRTAKERSLYLTYRQLARHILASRLAQLLVKTGEQPEGESLDQTVKRLRNEMDPRAVAEKLFALQDRRRLQAQQRATDKALAEARGGDLARAVSAFDKLLALDPDHPLRGRMAKAFQRQADHLLHLGKYDAASMMATKALHLLGGGSTEDARRARAVRLVAEALGRGDEAGAEWRLSRAVELAPSLEVARRRLERLRSARRRSIIVTAGVSAGVGAALLALLLLLRRRWS